MVGGATNICRQVVRRLLDILGEWKGWVGSLNNEPSLVLGGLDWIKDPFHRFVLLHLLLTRQQRQRYISFYTNSAFYSIHSFVHSLTPAISPHSHRVLVRHFDIVHSRRELLETRLLYPVVCDANPEPSSVAE